MPQPSLHSQSRASIVSLSLVAALLGAATPAAAQGAKPSAADVAAAKKDFQTGLKLFKEGLFREALAAFLSAKKSMPRESIQRNIAASYRELKEFGNAHDAYVEMLESYGSTMKKADVAVVQRAIDELKLLTGTIQLSVPEAGAQVKLDDRDIGQSPLSRTMRVNIGSHKITASKPGFEPFSRVVETKGNDQIVVDAVLKAEVETGRLSVTADGELDGARLFVDTRQVSSTLPWSGELPPGVHDVEIKGPDTSSGVRKVDVIKGRQATLALHVELLLGRTLIEAGLPEAEIIVDGRSLGTGAWEGRLGPGRHELLVQAPGYEPHRRVFLVQSGEKLLLKDIRLVPSGAVMAPLPPAQEHDYTGLYTQMHLLGALGNVTNELATDCRKAPGSHCDVDRASRGAGFGLRVGYSLGIVGIEGFVLGMYDQSKATLNYADDVPRSVGFDRQGVARKEDYVFQRYGGAGGLAVRATSKHDTIRFTAGAGGGLALKSVGYSRETKAIQEFDAKFGSDSFSSDTPTYTAPMAIFDAGILLGSTPGSKFHLGGFLMLDFLGKSIYTEGNTARFLGDSKPANKHVGIDPSPTQGSLFLATPPMSLTSGTQLFYGIIFGMQIGE
jgi:hypothetical protein